MRNFADPVRGGWDRGTTRSVTPMCCRVYDQPNGGPVAHPKGSHHNHRAMLRKDKQYTTHQSHRTRQASAEQWQPAEQTDQKNRSVTTGNKGASLQAVAAPDQPRKPLGPHQVRVHHRGTRIETNIPSKQPQRHARAAGQRCAERPENYNFQ